MRYRLRWAVLGNYILAARGSRCVTSDTDPPGCNDALVPALQGGELNVLLQLPWVDADVIKKISRKGGARSVAELMRMGEQERLELFVTSGNGSSMCFCVLSESTCQRSSAWAGRGHGAALIPGKALYTNAIPVILRTYASVDLHLLFPLFKGPQMQRPSPGNVIECQSGAFLWA